MRYQAALRPDSSDYPTAPPPGARTLSFPRRIHASNPHRRYRDLPRSRRAVSARRWRPFQPSRPASLKPARPFKSAGRRRRRRPPAARAWAFGRDDHNLSVRQGHQQIDLHQPVPDSIGTKTTTVSVTTFASLAEAIDEIKVIPPRRRSVRTDTTTTGDRGSLPAASSTPLTARTGWSRKRASRLPAGPSRPPTPAGTRQDGRRRARPSAAATSTR